MKIQNPIKLFSVITLSLLSATLLILVAFFISISTANAETQAEIDKRRHDTSPYVKLSLNKNKLTREQYELISTAMARSFKHDLDDQGKKNFVFMAVNDMKCRISQANLAKEMKYTVICPK